MTLRPYQSEALAALDAHLASKTTNPCIVIPTGGGKSLIIAEAIRRWKAEHPPLRALVLAHRQELVSQNAEELRGLLPGGNIGIYAAGLGKRDEDADILFASIDSIAEKSHRLAPFDVIIVDEAHRIPAAGEGKYRRFITAEKAKNDHLRVVGMTATPYRLGVGPICHPTHLLHEVAYEAHISDLIRDGYLCPLRSRIGAEQPDLSKVKKSAGDYNLAALAAECSTIVRRAVEDAVARLLEFDRKAVIFFCIDIEHATQVSQLLASHRITAPVVSAKTPQADRDRITEQFKAGKLHAICNVNCFTEGFNARQVDAVVLLRPTMSKGLYVQMVGRGLRLHPQKEYCMVLDYGQCIEQHGPINAIDSGEVRIVACGNCGDVFSRALRVCPFCQWEIPKKEVQRMEAADEKARKLHEAKASNRQIIGDAEEELKVDDVELKAHYKPGSRPSLRVVYRCGMTVVSEWICLGWPGFAGDKAVVWWLQRFGSPPPTTVEKAEADLFFAKQLAIVTESITVRRAGKWLEITKHKLRSTR